MGNEIKSTVIYNPYKVNNIITDTNNNDNLNSTTNNNIEEILLNASENEYDNNNGQIIYSNGDNVTITKNIDGSYSITVKTNNSIVNYELYDQGRGIGLSDHTNSLSKMVDLKEKLSDSELEAKKNQILAECRAAGLSPERLALLEELLNDDIFLTALNDFTIGNGCGTYSLLEVLNGYYNLEINEIDFFTSFLIKNLHDKDENINDGFDAWLEIIFGKINNASDDIGETEYNNFYKKLYNLTKEYPNESEEFKNSLSTYLNGELNKLKDAKTGGPLTTSAMKKILDNLNLKNERLLYYSSSDFDESGQYEHLLKNQLQSGKPVVLMVENLDDIDLEEFTQEYGRIIDDENGEYVKSIMESGEDYYALTNSHHFFTILCMDDNENVLIADSRYLPDDVTGQKKYSHIMEMNYNDLIKFIESPVDSSGATSNTYGKEQAGMLLVD